MHLTTAFTLLAGTVASVSAAALVPKDTSEFTLTAQNPGTVIHDRALIASQGRLWLSRAWSKQDASCKWDQEKPPAEGAILFLKGDELFLYGGREESHQQLALDPKEDGTFSRLVFFFFHLSSYNSLMETYPDLLTHT